MITIRPATAADAAALAVFAEAQFRHSHAGDSASADLDAYCRKHFGSSRQLEEIRSPGTTFFLALSNDELAGYLQLRLDHAPPCELPIPPQRFSEAKRVYVDATHQGSGLASQLMETCFKAASMAGSDLIWLSVWKQNHRAIAFYRKQGFEVAGETTFTVGREVQEDFIMTRPLQASQ